MANVNRGLDEEHELTPEEQAAYDTRKQEAAARDAAAAEAARVKAAGRDPAIANLLRELGADNEATRTIAARVYDQYNLTSMFDIGRSDPYTYNNEDGEPVEGRDFINKKTGEKIGGPNGLALGTQQTNKGQNLFTIGPDGQMSGVFISKPEGFWDQVATGILPMANMIPGINAITIPLTAAYYASHDQWGRALATIAPMGLNAIATGTNALSNLSGSADFNPTATTPAGMLTEAATGIQGRLADVIGSGTLGGVTSALSGGDAARGALNAAVPLAAQSAGSVEIGNTGVTVGDVAKGALIVANLTSDNPNYGAAIQMAGELVGSRDTVLAGKAVSLVQALEGGNPAAISSAINGLARTAGPNNVRTAVESGGNQAAVENQIIQSTTDTLGRNEGNDTIGSGVDSLAGASGNDTVSAGDGSVSPTAQDTTALTTDTVSGGNVAVDATNTIVPGTGADTVSSGNDTIVSGNDTVASGTGVDTIVSGTGVDTIVSGTGVDTIVSGTGVDTIVSGTGEDTALPSDADRRLSNSRLVETTAAGLIDGGMSVNDAFRLAAAENGLTEGDYDRPSWSIVGGDQVSLVTTGNNQDTTSGGQDTTSGGQNTVVELTEDQPILKNGTWYFPQPDGSMRYVDDAGISHDMSKDDWETLNAFVNLDTASTDGTGTQNLIISDEDSVEFNGVRYTPDGHGNYTFIDPNTGEEGTISSGDFDLLTQGTAEDGLDTLISDLNNKPTRTLETVVIGGVTYTQQPDGSYTFIDPETGEQGSLTEDDFSKLSTVQTTTAGQGSGRDLGTVTVSGGLVDDSYIFPTGSDTVSLISSTQPETISLVGSSSPDTVALVSAVASNIGSSKTDTVSLISTGQISVSSVDNRPVGSDTVTLLGSPATATTTPAADSELPIRKVGDLGEYVSPLAGYQQMVQQMYNTAMDEKFQQQKPAPYQGQEDNSFWGYGQQEKPLDSIFGAIGSIFQEPEVKAATGGSIAALLAVGGSSRRGSTALVPHSGKMRVDFRHGDAVAGPGDGQSDDIPAMLADGEFVFPADVVSALGNGSTKAGSDKLYEMMHSIRARARKAHPKSLPPPAKSPLEYLRGKK